MLLNLCRILVVKKICVGQILLSSSPKDSMRIEVVRDSSCTWPTVMAESLSWCPIRCHGLPDFAPTRSQESIPDSRSTWDSKPFTMSMAEEQYMYTYLHLFPGEANFYHLVCTHTPSHALSFLMLPPYAITPVILTAFTYLNSYLSFKVRSRCTISGKSSLSSHQRTTSP